jgi:hypothetical protein
MPNIKVLIITLTIGEPQLPKQKGQLNTQQGVDLKHVVISDMSADEAMRCLINECELHRGQFDYVIKLDGDMTLSSNDTVLKIVERLENTNKDRLTLTVFDYILRMRIFGVHIFKLNKMPKNIEVTAHKRDDWLLGMNGTIQKCKDNLVLHCESPSPLQLYTFGFNRGLKTQYKKQDFRYVYIVSLINYFFYADAKYCIKGFIDGLNTSLVNHDTANVYKAFLATEKLSGMKLVKESFFMNPLLLLKACVKAINIKLKLK